MNKKIEKKRILFISQYFWPENFRVNELVLELKRRGYEICVLTGTPNYPLGKVYPDYLANKSKYKNYHGIKIHRVFQLQRNNNKFSLILNYLSFAISASIFCLLNIRKLKFDLIVGIQLSPILSMIPAIILKKTKSIPLYIWVLDIWPDSLIATGVKSKFILNSLEKICVRIYSAANILFLSSHSFKDKLQEMGINKPKLVYFPQWIESDYLDEINEYSPEAIEVKKIMAPWKDKIIFTFTGNIGDAQDFPNLIKSLQETSNLDKIIVLIIGEGRYKSELIKNIQTKGLGETVFCLGQFSAKFIPFFYHYSDFLILPLKNIPVFSLTLPGKMQSYMSSGRPIIGMASGEVAKVINESKCGFVVPSGDTQGLSKIINECCVLDPRLSIKLGANGKSYALENFHLKSILDNLGV